MSLYLDASLLVSVLSRELASSRTRNWLGKHASAELSISDWVATEVASALAMKVRTGAMTTDEHDAALRAFAEAARSFEVKPVPRSAFRTAARFCATCALGLRSGDALHLALCSEGQDTLCTLDRRLASAGAALGVQTLLL